MSDTPRTDAMIQPVQGRDCATGDRIPVVHADDCRKLERELAAVTAERDSCVRQHNYRLKACLQQIERAERAESRLRALRDALSDVVTQVSFVNRYRDTTRHPKVANALTVARTLLAKTNGESHG